MSPDDEMLRDHQKTWNGFVRLFFVAAIALAALLGLLALVFYA